MYLCISISLSLYIYIYIYIYMNIYIYIYIYISPPSPLRMPAAGRAGTAASRCGASLASRCPQGPSVCKYYRIVSNNK